MTDEQTMVVRIRAELVPLIDAVVETDADQYGIRRYNSRKDVVTQAVKEFLDRRRKEAKR